MIDREELENMIREEIEKNGNGDGTVPLNRIEETSEHIADRLNIPPERRADFIGQMSELVTTLSGTKGGDKPGITYNQLMKLIMENFEDTISGMISALVVTLKAAAAMIATAEEHGFPVETSIDQFNKFLKDMRERAKRVQ